jgi:hypothetical protein
MDSDDLADIRGLPDLAFPSVGYDVGLDFSPSKHVPPDWSDMRQEISSKIGRSVALIDNTTATNAVALFEDGLMAPVSARAALLPDLATLIFGLAHFDHLLVIDHGNSEPWVDKKLRMLTEMSDGAVQPVRVNAGNNAGRIAGDLESKFVRLQYKFFDRPDLHGAWQKTWSALMGAEVAEPVPFSIEHANVTNAKYRAFEHHFEHDILRTPKHPLQDDRRLGTPRHIQVPDSLQLYGGQREEFSAAECRAIFASYHTFRSMFYHALSDYLNAPYLACALRQATTHVLPIADARSGRTINAHEVFQAVERYNVRDALKFAVPVVQVAPTLAAFFAIASEEKKGRALSIAGWTRVLRRIRAQSMRYRRVVLQLVEGFESGDLQQIDRVFRELNTPKPDLTESATSVLSAAARLKLADYKGAADDFWKLLASKPWETVARLATRWQISFILKARDTASRCLSLEAQCNKIWGRGFSERERAYLTGLVTLHTEPSATPNNRS